MPTCAAHLPIKGLDPDLARQSSERAPATGGKWQYTDENPMTVDDSSRPLPLPDLKAPHAGTCRKAPHPNKEQLQSSAPTLGSAPPLTAEQICERDARPPFERPERSGFTSMRHADAGRGRRPQAPPTDAAGTAASSSSGLQPAAAAAAAEELQQLDPTIMLYCNRKGYFF